MADRYWVGGTASWDATVGTKWALTSGAAGGQAVPTAVDTVFLDANSGANTVTVSGTRTCLNIICSGFTGTLAGTSTPIITVCGTICTLGSGMTFAASGPRFATGAATQVALNTNGITIRGITVGFASSTMLFNSAVTSASSIILTSGTINANNQNVVCTALIITGSTGRTMTMGNGAWVINGASITQWDSTTTSSLTYNAGSATITFAPGGGTCSIAGGSLNIANAVTISQRTDAARVQIAGTFGSLTITGPDVILLTGSLSITGGTWTGAHGSMITIKSSSVGTQQTLTTSGAVTGGYVAFADIAKAGAGTITCLPCVDLGNNSGITFRPLLPRATQMIAV